MWVQSIGNFFKHVGVEIAKVFEYLPALEKKFAKAVTDAKADTAEVVATGKPFISAIAVASAAIVAAGSDKGLNWKEDTAAVAAVEAAFKLWPAFWHAIEKEGADIGADLGVGTTTAAAAPADTHTPVILTTEGSDAPAPPAEQGDGHGAGPK